MATPKSQENVVSVERALEIAKSIRLLNTIEQDIVENDIGHSELKYKGCVIGRETMKLLPDFIQESLNQNIISAVNWLANHKNTQMMDMLKEVLETKKH